VRCTSSLSCRGRSATRPAENHHFHTVRRATEARLTTYPALTGGIGIVFGSPDFPEDVKSVFFDVAIPLRSRFKYEVGNKCTLFLDFRRPEVVNLRDASLPADPERDQLRREWQRRHVGQRRVSRVHRVHAQPPLENVVVAPAHCVRRFALDPRFPFALWCDARAATLIQKASASTFVQAAFYVYVFFGALVGIRFLFHYARWIWPLVEYRQPRNRALKHKAVWSAIVLGVVSSLIYDMAKKLF